MLTTALPRRGMALMVTVSTVVAVLLSLATGPAFAQDEETDSEGAPRSLREALDEASRKYQDAKDELDKSEKRELKLLVKLEDLDDERDDLIGEIQVVAAAAYRTGRLGPVTAMINASSPDALLERVAAVDMIAKRDAQTLERFAEVAGTIEDRQAELAEEIATQEKQVEKLEEAKKDAEDALFAVGGGATGEFEPFEAEDAEPGPGFGNGFPGESCSQNDPTTGGCVSPRMLHAYDEAQIFGFTRHTSCWRDGSFGEHPLGRACDFSAQVGGFGGVATGADKEYGDRLASFFVHNADRLGVQYVIWYRQIYINGAWKAYGSAGGDPSSDHTNHVHLSVL